MVALTAAMLADSRDLWMVGRWVAEMVECLVEGMVMTMVWMMVVMKVG